MLPVPLFAALDGSRPADYAERVEPSAAGGARLAALLLDAALAGPEWADRARAAAVPPRQAQMR